MSSSKGRKAAKKPGKPRIEIDIARVTELASRGLSQGQIAAALGISERTLRNRKTESAEFAEAIEKGQALGIEAVANALFDNAEGGNVTAQIFFLKARAGWREKQEVELTGPGGGPVVTLDAGKLSDAALQELLSARRTEADGG